jgi:hypothetical protein
VIQGTEEIIDDNSLAHLLQTRTVRVKTVPPKYSTLSFADLLIIT